MQCKYCEGCGVIVTIERGFTTFEEAGHNSGKPYTREHRQDCKYCNGTGQQVYRECYRCHGKGSYEKIEKGVRKCHSCNSTGFILKVDGTHKNKERCPSCHGIGQEHYEHRLQEKCPNCAGNGKVRLTAEEIAEEKARVEAQQRAWNVENARRIAEEAQRRANLKIREDKLCAEGRCLICEKPLGFFQRLVHRKAHFSCK
ncbi:MAG: hypothetical protein KJZ86_24330 [Caldilineaceae bacterium]|nr:hypothetical protein [Caldilineaceae bacterium]